MEPMQQPLPDRKDGEWWMRIEEVFHAGLRVYNPGRNLITLNPSTSAGRSFVSLRK